MERAPRKIKLLTHSCYYASPGKGAFGMPLPMKILCRCGWQHDLPVPWSDKEAQRIIREHRGDNAITVRR